MSKLASNWISTSIGEQCVVIAGQSPQGRYYNETGDGLPFYQGKKAFGEKYIGEPLKWTTHTTKEALAGDVLMSVRAPVGPINFSTQKICIGRGLAAIRVGDHIEKEFLFYALLSKQNEICGNEGAVFASINKAQIQNIKLDLPSIEEQVQIVTVINEAFEAIDKVVANAEKNLTNAREIFENHLNSLFTQKGNGWVATTLGELCDRVEYGTSSKSKPEGSVPVLRMGNIQNGKFNWGKLVYTNGNEEIEKYLLKNGDVLFNRTNSAELVGKTAIYRGERPAIFAGYLIRVHRKAELIDAEFLNYYLNSIPARAYGETVMSRSINQANINGTKLKQYPFSIPSLRTQQEIVGKLRVLEVGTQRLEAIYQQKLTSLAELKQSILKKAFADELAIENTSAIKKEAAA